MTGAIECRYYGRDFTADEMALLRALIAADPQPTRAALSREFCRRIGWLKPDGGLKDMMAKVTMLAMHRDGVITLPPPRGRQGRPKPIVFGPDTEPPLFPAPTTLDEVRPLDFRTLVPRLEIGVRHDGGDAETGFGLDLGGGLAWSDPGTGVRAEVSGRGLLTHAAGGFRERGIAGRLGWDPTPGSDRGPSLTLSQTMSVSARGGADALLGRTTLAGLAANDNGDELERRRLEVKLGYGFGAFGDRFTSTPEVGFGMSEGHRDYSLAWRFVRDRRCGDIGSLGFSVEVRWRESANDPGSGSGAGSEPVHGVGFRMTARY